MGRHKDDQRAKLAVGEKRGGQRVKIPWVHLVGLHVNWEVTALRKPWVCYMLSSPARSWLHLSECVPPSPCTEVGITQVLCSFAQNSIIISSLPSAPVPIHFAPTRYCPLVFNDWKCMVQLPASMMENTNLAWKSHGGWSRKSRICLYFIFIVSFIYFFSEG